MQGTGNFLQGSNSSWKTASPSSPLFLLLLFSNWCLLLLTAQPLGSPHLRSPNITAHILGQHSIYGIATVPPEILGILCSQTPETMTVKFIPSLRSLHLHKRTQFFPPTDPLTAGFWPDHRSWSSNQQEAIPTKFAPKHRLFKSIFKLEMTLLMNTWIMF